MSLNTNTLGTIITGSSAFQALYDSLADQALVDALNAPAAQVQLVPMSTTAILGLLGPASLAKLYHNPNAPTIREDIRQGDRAAFLGWIGMAEAAGDVTQQEAAAVRAAVAETVTVQVSAIEECFGTGTVASVSDMVALRQSLAGPAAVRLAASVTVQAPATMKVGELATATAVVLAADRSVITDRPITWQGSDTAVLGVHDDGELRAIAVGVVTVVAIIDGVQGTAQVVVA